MTGVLWQECWESEKPIPCMGKFPTSSTSSVWLHYHQSWLQAIATRIARRYQSLDYLQVQQLFVRFCCIASGGVMLFGTVQSHETSIQTLQGNTRGKMLIKTPKNKFWQTACATEAKSCVCIRKLHVYSVQFRPLSSKDKQGTLSYMHMHMFQQCMYLAS